MENVELDIQKTNEASAAKKRSIAWAIGAGALTIAAATAVALTAPYLAGVVSSLASWSWSTVSGVIWGWEIGGVAVGEAIGYSFLAIPFGAFVGVIGAARAEGSDACAGFIAGACIGGFVTICGAALGIGLGVASLGCFLAPALPFIAGLGIVATIGLSIYKSVSNAIEAKKISESEPGNPPMTPPPGKDDNVKNIAQEHEQNSKENEIDNPYSPGQTITFINSNSEQTNPYNTFESNCPPMENNDISPYNL